MNTMKVSQFLKENVIVIISILIAVLLISLGLGRFLLQFIADIIILVIAVGIGYYIQSKVNQNSRDDDSDIF